MAQRPRGMTVLSYLIALTAMCLALGYIDAVASFHLRGMVDVAEEGADLARVATEAMPPRIVALEQTRQAATVLVLVTVGVIAGRNVLQQVGTAVFGLGAWLVLRYLAIRTVIDWPTSLTDADTVMYLPEPVHAPVGMVIIAGVGLSALGFVLIRGGALALRRS